MRSKALTYWADDEDHSAFRREAERANLSTSALLGQLVKEFLVNELAKRRQKRGKKSRKAGE